MIEEYVKLMKQLILVAMVKQKQDLLMDRQPHCHFYCTTSFGVLVDDVLKISFQRQRIFIK